jgi:hypothetical protein
MQRSSHTPRHARVRERIGELTALVRALILVVTLGLSATFMVSAASADDPVGPANVIVFVGSSLGPSGVFNIDSSWHETVEDGAIIVTLDPEPESVATPDPEIDPEYVDELFGSGTYPIGDRYFGRFDPHVEVSGTYQVVVDGVEGDVVEFTVAPYPVPFPEAPSAVDQTADSEGYLVIPDQTFSFVDGTLNVLYAVDGELVDPGQHFVEPGTYNVSASLPGSLDWPHTYDGSLDWDLTVNPPPDSDPEPPATAGPPPAVQEMLDCISSGRGRAIVACTPA